MSTLNNYGVPPANNYASSISDDSVIIHLKEPQNSSQQGDLDSRTSAIAQPGIKIHQALPPEPIPTYRAFTDKKRLRSCLLITVIAGITAAAALIFSRPSHSTSISLTPNFNQTSSTVIHSSSGTTYYPSSSISSTGIQLFPSSSDLQYPSSTALNEDNSSSASNTGEPASSNSETASSSSGESETFSSSPDTGSSSASSTGEPASSSSETAPSSSGESETFSSSPDTGSSSASSTGEPASSSSETAPSSSGEGETFSSSSDTGSSSASSTGQPASSSSTATSIPCEDHCPDGSILATSSDNFCNREGTSQPCIDLATLPGCLPLIICSEESSSSSNSTAPPCEDHCPDGSRLTRPYDKYCNEEGTAFPCIETTRPTCLPLVICPDEESSSSSSSSSSSGSHLAVICDVSCPISYSISRDCNPAYNLCMDSGASPTECNNYLECADSSSGECQPGIAHYTECDPAPTPVPEPSLDSSSSSGTSVR